MRKMKPVVRVKGLGSSEAAADTAEDDDERAVELEVEWIEDVRVLVEGIEVDRLEEAASPLDEVVGDATALEV